jgi:hypothetical protein
MALLQSVGDSNCVVLTFPPTTFPAQHILQVLDMIMRKNLFLFGNHFFKYLLLQAMQWNGHGYTLCTCPFATMYYSYYEETSLLKPNSALL